MTDWYCKIAGKLYGPYDHARLRHMAAEGRLLPDDLVRDGEDGEWFPAEEIENLFPEGRRAEREADDDDDDRPRRRKKRKSVNYYSALITNLQQGGNWLQYVGWTAVFEGLLRGATELIVMLRAGDIDPVAFILWTIVGAIMVLAYCFVDVLLFGIVCVLLKVGLDPRRHHVLDLFGYAYVVGLFVILFRMLTSCISSMIAEFVLLLIPFFHGVVFVYLLQHYWDLSAQKAWGLAGIRFAYQMLFIGGWLVIRYYQ